MIHSKIFYNYCVWNDEESALWSLDNFEDIDILYDEGGIIRSICTKNNAKLLKAALDYFENKQFPDKGEHYEMAHSELVAVLEETLDWIDPLSPLNSLVCKYIGYDVARLSDVSETEMLVSSGQQDYEYSKEDATTEERDSRESRKDSDDIPIKFLPFTTENLESFGYLYWRLNMEAEEHYKKGEKSEAIYKIQEAIKIVAQDSNITAHIEHKAMVIYNYLRFTDTSWNEMVSNIKQDSLLHFTTEVLSIATARSDARITYDILELFANENYIVKAEGGALVHEPCSQIEHLTLSSKYEMPGDKEPMQQEVTLTGDVITLEAQDF